MNEKALRFIIQKTKKGYSREEIKKALIKAGFKEQEIRDAFEQILKNKGLMSANRTDDQIIRPKIKLKSAVGIISLSILIITFILIFTNFFFLENNKGQNLISKGWELYSEKKYTDAEKLFKEAKNKNPKGYWSYEGLGWTYYQMKEFEKAKKIFEEGIKINPKSGIMKEGLGIIYFQNKEFEEAEKDFEAAIKLDEKTNLAYFFLASINYAYKEDYERALYFLNKFKVEEVSDLSQTRFEFNSQLLEILILLSLKKYDKAEEKLQLLTNKEKVGDHYCLIFAAQSVIELNKGNIEAAKESYKKSKELKCKFSADLKKQLQDLN